MNAILSRGSWVVTLPVAAIAVLYVAFVWMPGRRAIVELQSQVESKQQFLAQSETLAAKVLAAQANLQKATGYVDAWEKQAPANRDISHFYGKLHALAEESGVVATRFDPRPAVSHERICETPLTLACTGTFGQIYALLRSIEGLKAPIWVESARIEKNGEKSQTVMCELSLVVFSDNLLGSDYAKHSE